jgi:hypothetical protein
MFVIFSLHITVLILVPQPGDNIYELTFVFTSLVMFSATQGDVSSHTYHPATYTNHIDIAVDGEL